MLSQRMNKPRIACLCRFYLVLFVLSLVPLFFIFMNRGNPNLKVYFKYLQPYLYAQDEMASLLRHNKLDYEFINIESKTCTQHWLKSERNLTDANDDLVLLHGIEEDYELLKENADAGNATKAAPQLKVLLLSIGKSTNYKSRLAARQTWYKFMNKRDVKLMFVVGNAAYNETVRGVEKEDEDSMKPGQEPSNSARLEKEMRDYGDIIQVNMPDDDDSASTKTLFAIRWAITYCEVAQNLFVLSDSSVLNHQLFDRLVMNGVLSPSGGGEKTNQLDDSSILGVCDRTDEKIAVALREFFTELYKKKQSIEYQYQAGSSSNHTRAERRLQNESISTATPTSTNRTVIAQAKFRGQYCSSLGWMITLNGAKKLWTTALRTSYMMNRSPAYLSGYLAFKAGLRHVSLFDYHEEASEDCLKTFLSKQNSLLCFQDFSNRNR